MINSEQFRPVEGKSARTFKVVKKPSSEPEPRSIMAAAYDKLMREVEHTCGEPIQGVLDRLYNAESRSYMEIGEQFGVSPDTVLVWMNNLDIPRQSRPAEPIATPVSELPPPDVVQETVIFTELLVTQLSQDEPEYRAAPSLSKQPLNKYILPLKSERLPAPRPVFKPLP